MILYSQFSSYTRPFFWRTICLSLIINFKLIFSRSIVRCCMWYICYYRTKISIHFHIAWSFSRTKTLSNAILNVNNTIRSEDGFKVMLFPYRDRNTKYIKIGFTTKFKLEKKLFTCTFVIYSFFWIEFFSVYVHKTNLIGKYVSI